MTYTGITQRANYAKEQSDISSINKLIQEYYATNESYPNTNNDWTGWGQQKDFIPGIVPDFASTIPNMPSNSDTSNSYLYISNGADYKLIRFSGNGGLPSVERTNNTLADPVRPVNNDNGGAWGYWSDGAVNW